MKHRIVRYLGIFLLLLIAPQVGLGQQPVALSEAFLEENADRFFRISTLRVKKEEANDYYSNYNRRIESLEFVVYVEPLEAPNGNFELELELRAFVENRWENELIGKMTSGDVLETYQSKFVIAVTQPGAPATKLVSLGRFYKDAEYSFQGGGRSFKKHFKNAEVSILRIRPLPNER